MNFPSLKPKFHQTMSAVKQTSITVKASLAAFWNEQKRSILWAIAIGLLVVITTTLFVYLWRHSVLFRAVVLALVSGLALGLNNILGWLKNRILQEQPITMTTERALSFGEHSATRSRESLASFEGERVLAVG
ncbi:MAG: hypothetical protein BroJett011_46560 [Chloroflexota bacterium]|nr:MAG: hypothetical protein BroJett011_46560 [Chloroflexota bacterium]